MVTKWENYIMVRNGNLKCQKGKSIIKSDHADFGPLFGGTNFRNFDFFVKS